MLESSEDRIFWEMRSTMINVLRIPKKMLGI